jgi:hypothetical protein
MKKVLLLLITGGCFIITSSSQQTIFSREYEGFINEPLTARIIPNEENDFFILSLNTDRLIKRYYVDKNGIIPLLEQHNHVVQRFFLYEWLLLHWLFRNRFLEICGDKI